MRLVYHLGRLRGPAQTALDGLIFVSGLLAGACLIYLVGWGTEGQTAQVTLQVAHVILWFFVASYPLRVLLQRHRMEYVRHHLLELLLVVMGVVFLAFEGRFLSDGAEGGGTGFKLLPLLYLMITQSAVLGVAIMNLLRINAARTGVALSPSWIFILSFLLMIGTGVIFLKLPEATHDPGLTWMEALFTSTSAVCVTGLIVVDTATRFTFAGQTILLVLFQVGGLGIMTFTYFFAHHLAGGISLRDRVVLSDLLSDQSLSRVTSMLGLILGATLVFEGIGAVTIYFTSGPEAALEADRPLWFVSIFHAVSAFCNAGFSVFSEGLAGPTTRGNIAVQATVVALIIIGGIGYPVLRDVGQVAWRSIEVHILKRRLSRRAFSLHTRIVLWTTLALLVAGTVLIWTLEFGLGNGISHTTPVFTAFFNSVTARTAGFNTVPMESLGAGTAFVMIVLMFIGGSPGGTSGGVKTTTFAVGSLNVLRILRNGRDVTIGNRRLTERSCNRAAAVLFLGGAWVFMAFVALLILEPKLDAIDLFFETVSAFGTVGLSRGVTAELGNPARAVIILTMFAGRVGILVFFLAFLPRRRESSVRMPEEGVILN